MKCFGYYCRCRSSGCACACACDRGDVDEIDARLCSFQQTRVDPNTPSEEFTTASIIISSWMKVCCAAADGLY